MGCAGMAGLAGAASGAVSILVGASCCCGIVLIGAELSPQELHPPEMEPNEDPHPLKQGSHPLKQGSQQLKQGSQQLKQGSQQLKQGLQQAKQGSQTGNLVPLPNPLNRQLLPYALREPDRQLDPFILSQSEDKKHFFFGAGSQSSGNGQSS